LRLAAGAVLTLAACGSPAPNKYDVSACRGLKQTIAQLPNGTSGNAGTMDTVALMGWVAIAKDQQLKQDITVLERSLVFIGSSYSQFGYDSEDTAVKAIGAYCANDGVRDIANGW